MVLVEGLLKNYKHHKEASLRILPSRETLKALKFTVRA